MLLYEPEEGLNADEQPKGGGRAAHICGEVPCKIQDLLKFSLNELRLRTAKLPRTQGEEPAPRPGTTKLSGHMRQRRTNPKTEPVQRVRGEVKLKLSESE